MMLVWLRYSLHISFHNRITSCTSTHYRCTLKTQEFRTKDFVVRSTHSIEHQKCKYCVGWRLAVATQPLIVEHQSASCPEGTRIRQKPTASSEGAQLWDKHHHLPLLVPQSGTDFPQHHTGCVSPPSGNYMGWRCRTYPQLRCFAACSGFHDIGPALRNPQLILNLLAFVGA